MTLIARDLVVIPNLIKITIEISDELLRRAFENTAALLAGQVQVQP